jgi:hypothetical protein
MRRLRHLALSFAAVGLPLWAPAQTTLEDQRMLTVAPNGNDAWSGRLAEANAARTDGPFATIERAQAEVRRLKAAGALTQPLTVCLRGGTYRVAQAIEFAPEDSGTTAAPVTYAAYPGERPLISGGRPIGGWRRGPGELWTADVPEARAGAWTFHQLFVNGQRRTRARTPNVGYLYSQDILAPFDRGTWYDMAIEAKTGFVFRAGDIRRWQGLEDALVVIYHSWTTSIHFITEIDDAKQAVKLAPKSMWPIGYWWEYNTRYHVENIPEALDEPGEWYLDRRAGVLSYWPLPGEEMTMAEVIAPVVRQTLLRFRGDPAAGLFVEHLRFEGLSFQHTDPYLAPDMPVDQQGATERQPLVAAVGLRHSVFLDCELAHAGENGLWLDRGCADNLVRHCHIHDLGGSAVYLGPREYAADEPLLVQRNTLDNNWLHDGSQLFRGSQGVWIGRSSHNQVTHNEISDFSHIGISVGHSWGYAPSTAHHNLIAFNHVHHICNGFFSDGGGIYTLGISPGTVIRGNLVHDVVPTPLMPQGGTGIYHDEGSTGILDEDNIVYNVGIPFHQHYGRENLARNNIFAFALRSPLTCARAEEHVSYTFEGNIVLSSGGQATSDHYNPMRCKTEFRRNLYWDVSGREPSFSGVSFAEWQASGRDLDSLIADPQFEDAPRFDFRLKATSPALTLGFRPIDVQKAGLYGDPEWVAAPTRVPRQPLPELPPPPPPPPPRPFLEDFESTDPGKQPGSLSYVLGDRPELVQVSEEVAAPGGRRSLKIIKAAGLKYPWQPHFLRSSRPYTTGKVRFACDVFNSPEAAAEFSLRLRDYSPGHGEYREGLALTLAADGTIAADGPLLTTVPRGVWVHLEVLLDLGAAGMATPAARTWRLAVTVSGQPEQVFAVTPCANPEFRELSWVGFCAGDQPDGVYYVDNLRLEAVP